MTAIYITVTTIILFNLAGIVFVIFILLTRPDTSRLKKANMKKNGAGSGIGHASKQQSGTSATAAAGAAAASYNGGIDDNDEFDDIDDILNDLDLSDFDDLDLSDFD